jgi:hypothetical protein
MRTAASSGARPIKRAGSAAGAASGKSKGEPAKRFVEPFQYDAAQRRAILDALADAGLADDDTREIFVGAIAYDLALLQAAAGEAAASEPAPSERESPERDVADREPTAQVEIADIGTNRRGALAETARDLAAQLDGLNSPQRQRLGAALRLSDPFDRDHDDAYLRALLNEIRRLADAAADIAPSVSAPMSATPEAAPAPSRAPVRRPEAARQAGPTSEDAIAFIRHAAKVYEQCFDSLPSSKASDPFARVLKVIAKATGVPVPSQVRVLKKALNQQ